QQLDDHLKAIESILRAAPPDALTTFRDGGSGWTALEVICHLRDLETLYFERARLTVEQERPALPNVDPDALAADRRYNEQDVETVLREWAEIRTAFAAFVRERGADDWERVGIHPRRGPLTLLEQL